MLRKSLIFVLASVHPYDPIGLGQISVLLDYFAGSITTIYIFLSLLEDSLFGIVKYARFIIDIAVIPVLVVMALIGCDILHFVLKAFEF
jgi:hypothetical protein